MGACACGLACGFARAGAAGAQRGRTDSRAAQSWKELAPIDVAAGSAMEGSDEVL